MEKEKTKFGKFLQKVGNTFGDVAEIGGNLLQGTAAGSALGVLGDILEGKASNAGLSEEERLLAQQFKQELELNKIDFEKEVYRMQVEDLKSARESNTLIQNDPDATQLAKLTPYLLDMFIALIWGVMTVFLVLKSFNINPSVEVDMSLLAGIYAAVSSQLTTVLGFHRGSSIGEKRNGFKLLGK